MLEWRVGCLSVSLVLLGVAFSVQASLYEDCLLYGRVVHPSAPETFELVVDRVMPLAYSHTDCRSYLRQRLVPELMNDPTSAAFRAGDRLLLRRVRSEAQCEMGSCSKSQDYLLLLPERLRLATKRQPGSER